jgi:hypothetical protein
MFRVISSDPYFSERIQVRHTGEGKGIWSVMGREIIG